MKIGLIGDTHGSIQSMRRVIAAAPPVEQWLHTGDYARDSLYLKSQTGLEVTAVCGNCDAGETDFNVDEFLYLQGFNIWLAHGLSARRQPAGAGVVGAPPGGEYCCFRPYACAACKMVRRCAFGEPRQPFAPAQHGRAYFWCADA